MNTQISDAKKRVVALGAVALLVGYLIAPAAFATTTVTDDFCNAQMAVTVASSTRSSTSSAEKCQSRALTAAGFALSSTSPTDATIVDSAAMVSAGGELYESFVAAARDAVVLLTPSRTLMMSRDLTGSTGIDWSMDLLVQPISGGTTAWLTGSYTLLRTNRDIRLAGASQSTAALAEVFDPVTMKVTFNGDGSCAVANYSSWFGYALTTSTGYVPTQPGANDYGFHQAVYAGAGSGQQHKESNLTLSTCAYALASDGKLVVTYTGTKGDASAFGPYSYSYYVSKDLQYIVSTADLTNTLYRGFEIGVRANTLSGTQAERNDNVAGTFLFNAPILELQGSTGTLIAPDVEHKASPKSIQCLARGSLVLTTNGYSGDPTNWNDCTIDAMANSCDTRSEEGAAGAVTITHGRTEVLDVPTCRFQIAADSTATFVINLAVEDGLEDVTFSGAISKNNYALILRGKYEGSNMANPSISVSPERTIKDDLVLAALVGIKYSGTLSADTDADGLDNEGEFIIGAESDSDTDGLTDAEEVNLGNNPFNVFDPPVVAPGAGFIVGLDNPSVNPGSANGTAWLGDGSLHRTGAIDRFPGVLSVSTYDVCGIGASGIGCLWWAMDDGVVYNDYLQTLQIDGSTVAPIQDETGYLRYEVQPGVWASAITDAYRISGDNSTHACVVSQSLGVYCWASDSSTDTVASTVPAGLKNVTTVADVAVGTGHACAINGSTVTCWGDSSSGKTTVPGAVSSPERIAAGSNHTCAINSTGTVSCWGDNTYSQKGDADVNGYVDGVSNALRIAAGDNHTCVVTGTFSTGGTSVVCWGDNSSGQTSVPSSLTDLSTTPVDVRAAGNETCAVKASYDDSASALQCWPTGLLP